MPKYIVEVRTGDEHRHAIDHYEIEAPNEMQAEHEGRMRAAREHGGKGKDYEAQAHKEHNNAY